jgi:virulence factor Mce-like protein
MSTRSRRAAVARQRLQGLAFLVVLALLLGLAVAQYQKAFSGAVPVTLKTDTIGNQLQEASDVKIRGVLVGDVRSVSADADGATITLAIDPDHLKDIPADVSARLLPKTLFGERFVSLVPPEKPTGEKLAAGAVIGQDRSENALELQRVVDDLLPLLKAVSPQDLSYTLGAVADALRGRGDRLGENLATLGSYVGQVNTVMPQLQADISRIADVSDTYDSAADDLLAVLDNLSVTSNTLVDQSEQLRRTFTVVDSSSTTAADFLTQNENSLISLAATSRPVLGLLAEYSPEYPCLLNGLARYKPLITEAFGGDGDPALNLNITVQFPPRNPYVPGDQPAYIAHPGPSCAGLDDIDGLIAGATHCQFYNANPQPDGVESQDGGTATSCGTGNAASTAPPTSGLLGKSWPVALNDGGIRGGLAGSSAELDFVRGLLGYQTGVDPSDVSDLAASTLAPLLRGTQVVIP